MACLQTDAATNEFIGLLPVQIRVALVEDRTEIREGLREMIAGSEGFACCGAYGSMEEALPAIGSAAPDVGLIDISLPGMSGVDGIREIRQRHQNIRMLVLSAYNDDERLFAAICAGACGYLLKKTRPAKLLESIREVVAGGAPMSPEIASRVLKHFARSLHRARPTTILRRMNCAC